MAEKTDLSRAKAGALYQITNFCAKTASEHRLADLGFVKGTRVVVRGRALFGTTVAVTIRNSTVCIRRDLAEKIFVVSG